MGIANVQAAADGHEVIRDPAESRKEEYVDDSTNRTRAGLPGLLKAAYLVIAGGCLGYFSLRLDSKAGDYEDAQVRVLNAATQASAVLVYAIAAMVIIFGLVVISCSFGRRRGLINNPVQLAPVSIGVLEAEQADERAGPDRLHLS